MKFTKEKDHSSVNNVSDVLHVNMTLQSICWRTQVKNPTNVKIAKSVSKPNRHFLFTRKIFTTRTNP